MSKARQLADLGNVYDDGALSNRNRIINGAMVIDQRNGGAAVSISSAGNTYVIDRWRANASGGGVFSLQQSTTAPAGFINSLLATVTTADASVVSGDFYHVRQTIEGFNFADASFGTSDAKPVTLSFWVRNSLTGTFTATLRNNAGNRGYVATYTINSANTWEHKEITITGDTTGTWPTDNTGSVIVNFNLGHGDTQTVGSWQGSVNEGASGMTQWISTLGATFYLTGVQLEVSDIATPFEHIPYSDQLARCQRYYTITGAAYSTWGNSSGYATWSADFPVEMRAAPTLTRYNSGGTIYTSPRSTKRQVDIFLSGQGTAIAYPVGYNCDAEL